MEVPDITAGDFHLFGCCCITTGRFYLYMARYSRIMVIYALTPMARPIILTLYHHGKPSIKSQATVCRGQ